MNRNKRIYKIMIPAMLPAVLFLAFSCSPREDDLTQYVDVFIGTGRDGHTWPGAALPFGMVQLSPDTRLTGGPSCGGYYYPDSTILGFSHTHLSGVGEPEFRDILFMPGTGKIRLTPGSPGDPHSGYRSAYDHTDEQATPGYYSVLLKDHNIRAELTATPRCGFQRYTFPASASSHIIIDLTHPGGAEELILRKVSNTEIEGLRRSHGWAWDQWVYFVSRFSRPFDTFLLAVDDTLRPGLTEASGKNLKAVVSYTTREGETILIKTGISAVSIEGARRNLAAEIPGWAFDSVRAAARRTWDKELRRIEVTGGTPQQKKIFYTALYHAFLSPYLFMDVDSLYRGIDHKVHRARGFTNYTVFSLWDTFRALHPFFTILQRKKTVDFIRSLLAKYDDGGRLPMWPLAGNYTDDMIGYHAVSVITDARVKGIRDFDAEKAFRAMKEVANLDRLGLRYYTRTGFVPDDRQGESVSKTLEYCYDDWCIARMAASLGKEDDYLTYHQRAWFYRNVFDTTCRFMRPRLYDRSWRTPFDPLSHHGFTEANAYQYLFVPHDIPGVIRLMGGDSVLTAWLDTLFSLPAEDTGKAFIGQYNHGNEPSHHLAWLYDYTGQPWKTQKRVHRIMQQCYTARPDGLSGNEDCGQMSAWYIFGAMGFYPVTPGTDHYVFGTPLFRTMTLHLENGKDLIIKARNISPENFYIRKITLNGKVLSRTWIRQEEIMHGGEIIFTLGPQPDKTWGTGPAGRPPAVNGQPITHLPFIRSGTTSFLHESTLSLDCDSRGAVIRYGLHGTGGRPPSQVYRTPFTVVRSCFLTMNAAREGMLPGTTVTIPLEKAVPLPPVRTVSLTPGLTCRYYERFFFTCDDLDKVTPVNKGVAAKVSLQMAKRPTYFGLRFDGLIRVPATGMYTFFLASNDGSRLLIDGREIIRNDGNHATVEEWGSIALQKGIHRIEVKYFQCGGGKELKLSWKGPGFGKKEVKGFYHER